MACEQHDDIVKRQDQHQHQLEALSDRVTKLETSSARYDEKIERIFADIDSIKLILADIQDSIKVLTGKPGQKWESMTEKILMIFVGGALTYIISQIIK